jgi:hydroxyacylglutathione hydrolase
MIIHQFYDKGLAHASYAIIRLGKMIVIDPARDPEPYYNFASFNNADIAGIIETHPHADFVSSHLEIHKATGAPIYVSKLLGAEYPHESFDDGDVIQLADIKLKAINTPGHSPDSICVLLQDRYGNDKAIFTGDTLFVGDVGRPDLRENVGNITAQKEELAGQLYHSTREKLMTLPPNVIVYPAHGPGSLCGKNISPDLQSTIGREIRENYALMQMDEPAFVKMLTSDQPFIPKYFGYDVEINKKGAEPFDKSVASIPEIDHNSPLQGNVLIVDTRPYDDFKNGHIKGAFNIQDGERFETWLGSTIGPEELFYLIAADKESMETLIKKAAKIGYEKNIKAALLAPDAGTEKLLELNLADFKLHTGNYTIVDVRNWGEISEGKIFDDALTIPLPELRERLSEIPTNKPIVVHCAAGYRSAVAASIISGQINTVPVYNLGEAIVEFGGSKSEVGS